MSLPVLLTMTMTVCTGADESTCVIDDDDDDDFQIKTKKFRPSTDQVWI